jgi:adenylate cyclase
MSTERRLAAVLAADVVGSSRLIEADEAYALAEIRSVLSDIVAATASRHGGRLIKTMGDGALLEFASPVAAVICADEVQRELAERARSVEPERRIILRIGINLGDVVGTPDGDLYGDGVNVAARLEALAEPGGIAISNAVHEHLTGKSPIVWSDGGERSLKNISRPVRIWLSGAHKALPLRPTLALPDKPSIAVLPFENRSRDAEQDYFADGVVEDVITELSRIDWLFVIARNSSFAYKGKAIDIRQIGRELGVRYVLEGSVRRSAMRLRITGQLIEAETGRHVWADRFDGNVDDVFDLQDRITESIVGAIEPRMRSAEIERVRTKPTENLGAYDCYLLALATSYAGTKEDLINAQNMMLKAVELDLNYAAAKAAIARIVMVRTVQGWASANDVMLGISLAREALANPNNDAMTLRNAGHSLAYLAREFDLGVATLKRALSLNPNSAQILSSSGFVHNFAGDTETAIKHFTRAIRLSPIDPETPHFFAGLGLAHSLRFEHDEALNYAVSAMSLNSNYALPYRLAIVALYELGRHEEARKMGTRILMISPDFKTSSFLFPIKDQSLRAKWGEAFKAAGLPE